MRIVLKAAVVLVPVLALVGLLRLCDGDSGRRWLERVRAVDDSLQIGVDSKELIAIAPTPEEAAVKGAVAVETRAQLAEHYGDLLGNGLDRRMVVVVFRESRMIEDFAQRDAAGERRRVGDVAGLTNAARNAIYLSSGLDLSTTRHEVVHLLMDQSAPPNVRFSPWVLEGLAQYFESYAGGPFRLGGEERAMLRMMSRGHPLDVARLLAIQDYETFTGTEIQRNYADALLLMAYLMETQPRERVKEYLDGEKRGADDRRRLFENVFGDPAGVAAAAGNWLRG